MQRTQAVQPPTAVDELIPRGLHRRVLRLNDLTTLEVKPNSFVSEFEAVNAIEVNQVADTGEKQIPTTFLEIRRTTAR